MGLYSMCAQSPRWNIPRHTRERNLPFVLRNLVELTREEHSVLTGVSVIITSCRESRHWHSGYHTELQEWKVFSPFLEATSMFLMVVRLRYKCGTIIILKWNLEKWVHYVFNITHVRKIHHFFNILQHSEYREFYRKMYHFPREFRFIFHHVYISHQSML